MSAVAERIRLRAAKPEALKRETPPAQDTPTLKRPDGKGAPLRLTPFKLNSLAPQDRATHPFSEKGATCPSCPEDSRRASTAAAGQAGPEFVVGRFNTADQKALVAAADARGDFARWSADLQVSSLTAGGNKGAEIHMSGNWRCEESVPRDLCVAAEAPTKVNVKAESLDVVSFKTRTDAKVAAGKGRGTEEQYSGPCSDC